MSTAWKLNQIYPVKYPEGQKKICRGANHAPAANKPFLHFKKRRAVFYWRI
jgi:hypothetical protein